jgi:hypothetical protein
MIITSAWASKQENHLLLIKPEQKDAYASIQWILAHREKLESLGFH